MITPEQANELRELRNAQAKARELADLENRIDAALSQMGEGWSVVVPLPASRHLPALLKRYEEVGWKVVATGHKSNDMATWEFSSL